MSKFYTKSKFKFVTDVSSSFVFKIENVKVFFEIGFVFTKFKLQIDVKKVDGS